MNYDDPDLSNTAIDWQESQDEAMACAQVEYDEQQLEFELPF